jgi:hypothetical protein
MAREARVPDSGEVGRLDPPGPCPNNAPDPISARSTAMPRITCPQRIIGAICAGLLFLSATAPAHSALVGTADVLKGAQAQADRAELVQMLDRDAVRDQLAAMGVDPGEAKARVERMTDAEVARLQGRLDEAAAGGDALSVVLVIFLVFIITDAIGATDIFPFVDPVD